MSIYKLCQTTTLYFSFIASNFAADYSFTHASKKSLDTAIAQTRIQNNVAAVAYVIVSKDKLLLSNAQGVSDKKTLHPATLDTIFRIGSITKSFTALALLKLQEQGKISLHDPLKQHAIDAPLDNPWSKTRPVTIAHLLEHTSGLADLTKKEFNYPDAESLSLKQGLFINSQPRMTLWPAGLHKSYSNAGAGYAAYALENTTDSTYEEYVQMNIFQPLAMSSSNFFLNQNTKHHLATGYDTDGDTPIPYWHMILRPFGAINTTANDMSHFVQMLLNKGNYLSKTVVHKNTITQMETPQTSLAASTGLTFGYGSGMDQHIHNGFVFYGHSGDGDGYLAQYAYNRDIGLGYFVVINAFNHRAINTIQTQLEDYITVGQTKPLLPSPHHIDQQKLQSYTGKYIAATQRFPWLITQQKTQQNKIDIKLNAGLLQLITPNYARTLIATSNNHFRFSDEPVATMAFIQYENNHYFQSERGTYKKIKLDKD